MMKIGNRKKIKVFDAAFMGVNEIIFHAIKNIPKDGVYVGADYQRYPCFDSEDYASEDRFFWNFVFAKSQAELDKKLEILKRTNQLECNYNKLTGELHPMAYWEGDTYHDVFLTESTHD